MAEVSETTAGVLGQAGEKARWAVLGPGTISADFAVGLAQSDLGVLHAVGSSSPERAEAFAATHGASVTGNYEEILARSDVDAVYIGTVHPAHLAQATAALDAGKAVLCEKPLTTSYQDTSALIAHAQERGVTLVEAFKYRFSPLYHELIRLLRDGAIGQIHHIDSACSFSMPPHVNEGRLFDPALAGGGILDVGCYPVSFAVGLAGALGQGVGEGAAQVRSAVGTIGQTGVDEWASGIFELGAITATLRTGIRMDSPDLLTIHGSAGRIDVPGVWGTRRATGSSAVLHRLGRESVEIETASVDPFAAEADGLVRALRAAQLQAPEMPWADSALTARLLQEWRDHLS